MQSPITLFTKKTLLDVHGIEYIMCGNSLLAQEYFYRPDGKLDWAWADVTNLDITEWLGY